jgi:hypothetical protein
MTLEMTLTVYSTNTNATMSAANAANVAEQARQGPDAAEADEDMAVRRQTDRLSNWSATIATFGACVILGRQNAEMNESGVQQVGHALATAAAIGALMTHASVCWWGVSEYVYALAMANEHLCLFANNHDMQERTCQDSAGHLAGLGYHVDGRGAVLVVLGWQIWYNYYPSFCGALDSTGRSGWRSSLHSGTNCGCACTRSVRMSCGTFS